MLRNFLGIIFRRLSAWDRRWFTEREIILRSDDRVRYIRLQRATQRAIALSFGALLLWLGVSNVGWTIVASRYDQTRADLSFARQSYSDLQKKLRNDYDNLSAIAQEMHVAEQSLAALLAEAGYTQQSTTIAAMPAGGTTNDIHRFEQQLVGLKQRFGNDQQGIDRLKSSFAGLKAELAAREQQRDLMITQVNEINQQMAALRRSQESMAAQLADRARSNVAEIERTVAMTGLDVDRLLKKAEHNLAGRGGPLVPVSFRQGHINIENAVWPGVSGLDAEMARWENLQFLLKALPMTAPLDRYVVNSTFGVRTDPLTRRAALHEGVDLANQIGTPVLATAPGKVVFAGYKGNYGNLVEIDHGLGIVTRYGHLKSINVKVGQQVEFRDEVGLLGNSGRSTGPHVHYEVIVDGKPLDPMKFLEAGRYVFKG